MYNSNANSATILGGAYNITAFSETELEYALLNKGPISVAFHVTEAF